MKLEGGNTLKEFEKLEVKNVNFKYNDNQKLVLKDINLDVYKGQKVSIVGISGVGKTTLIKLLCRLYEPTCGQVKINGKYISKIDPKVYFNIFSIVNQQAVIFNATIKENILLGLQNISDDMILEVLKIVNFYDDILNSINLLWYPVILDIWSIVKSLYSSRNESGSSSSIAKRFASSSNLSVLNWVRVSIKIALAFLCRNMCPSS